MGRTDARRRDGVEGETVGRKPVLVVKKQSRIAEYELLAARSEDLVRVVPGEGPQRVVDNRIPPFSLHRRRDDDFALRLEPVQALDEDVDVFRQLCARDRDVVA